MKMICEGLKWIKNYNCQPYSFYTQRPLKSISLLGNIRKSGEGNKKPLKVTW